MNILREVRRVKKKSMITRIRLILVFSVIFIINTYAWFSIDKHVGLKNIEADVTSWDVAYYVNEDANEILNQTATFTIDELYPGMPDREDIVHIYNLGTSSTNIQYELISVKVFGNEVLDQLETDDEIETTENGTGATVDLFSKNTSYPFNISYTYDKVKLIGKYENDTSTPNSFATFQFNVDWAYEDDEDATAAENAVKDALDTQFGKQAYNYYNVEGGDPSKAIEIKVKITSSMLHPDLDPDFEENIDP